MASKPLYQIYAELIGYKLKVWRRFQVMNNITVAKLAYILMTLFEMHGNHLYLFEVDELANLDNQLKAKGRKLKEFKGITKQLKIAQYGCIFDEEIVTPKQSKIYKKLEDAKNIYLKNIMYKENDKMMFKYDFGDNWRFNIVLEKVFKDKETRATEFPRVIEGQGLGIIEDCGGTNGLESIKTAFSKNKGEEYELYSNWLGVKELDLEKCDLEDLNFRLKRLPRIFKASYEYNVEPSVQSVKLIERYYMKKF